jgi:hypothetical protein
LEQRTCFRWTKRTFLGPNECFVNQKGCLVDQNNCFVDQKELLWPKERFQDQKNRFCRTDKLRWQKEVFWPKEYVRTLWTKSKNYNGASKPFTLNCAITGCKSL